MAMGKWLMAAAMLAPTISQAGPNPAPRATEQPTPTAYAVAAPATHGYIPDGWALRATFRGRAMDLGSRDWSDDPHAQPRDIEAGYGWRDGRTTALIGFESHDYGPKPAQTARALERDPNQPPPVDSAGVLGFSLVVHGR
jgi:hypothetical protein